MASKPAMLLYCSNGQTQFILQFFPDKFNFQQAELTCLPPAGEDGEWDVKLMYAGNQRHRYEYMAERALEETGTDFLYHVLKDGITISASHS